MGIKEIFKEGMKELKRRSALGKEKRNLKQKQKLYSEQLTTLGKKAWESNIDIEQYGNMEKLIATTQQRQDELNSQHRELETRKKQTEEKRKEEDERFEARRKEVEEKKKEVDDRLDDEKKSLKEAQKDFDSANNRLNRIREEEDQLNKKKIDAAVPEEEKKEIPAKLDALNTERQELGKKIENANQTIDRTREAIVPLEEESAKHQKEIDTIRAEQKSVLGELDQVLSETREELNDCNKKLEEVGEEQSSHFEQLGENIAAARVEDSRVAAEMTDAQATEKEIAALHLSLEKLESRGTSKSRGAFWEMIGLTVAGIIVIIFFIILLSWLFGSGDKTAEPTENPILSKIKKTIPAPVADALDKYEKQADAAAAAKKKSAETPKTMEDAVKQMESATEEIKKQSEKMHGKEIVVADKQTLMSVLPQVAGWEMKSPSYHSQQFGQLQGAALSANYTGPDSRNVRVSVTDTGHASAVLRPYLMLFNLNTVRDDDRGYEKVSTYNDMRVIEKYDKRSKRARFTFIVKKRYLVALDTSGEGSIELLKNFITKFDLSRLE
jgi:hypothetical protein